MFYDPLDTMAVNEKESFPKIAEKLAGYEHLKKRRIEALEIR